VPNPSGVPAATSTDGRVPGRRSRRVLLVLLVLLLGLVGAAWSQVDPIDGLPRATDRAVSVIAHGGAQGHAPPNTMEAFDAALALGADTLEMDLQLTADGEVVTIHDGTVDRTTDGSGPVSSLTLAELQALDAGATWTPPDAPDADPPFAGQGVRHAAFAEVLERFPDTPLIVELKTDGGEAIIQPVIDLLVASGRDDGSVVVASFSADYLGPVREQAPDVPTNMPESETTAFYTRQLVGLHPWWTPPGTVFQVPETFDDRLVVTPRFTRAAERLGVDVQVWTVNEPEQMHRLLDAGAHAIMTDFPDRLVTVLEERAADRGGAVRGPDPSRYDTQLDRAERLQDTASWLTPLWAVVTFLGDEEFYLLLLPITYWALSRRIGLRLGAMLLLSASVNGLLKLTFTTPRPFFLRPELAQVSETSFGVPSGHAQNATAFWGVLAASIRSWPVRAGLVALIAAIAWSRIHLGVHFLEDLVVGVTVGLGLLGLYLWLEPRAVRWWRRVGTVERVLAALVAGLVWIAPATLLAGRLVGVSFPWPGVEDVSELTGASSVVTAAATLSGFLLGLAFLQVRGGFDHRGPVLRRVARVLVGFVGLVVLYLGLSALFPSGEGPVELTLRAVRYGLIGAWVGGLAPWLFVRLGLAAPCPGDEVGFGPAPIDDATSTLAAAGTEVAGGPSGDG
jgi:glycerophosphoryl diester phosphodiesterase/membrane-associated phospholipid phosphatase